MTDKLRILTVTPNSAVDRVLILEELIPGLGTGVSEILDCVGGKGLNASVALTGLGVASTALTFLAGESGKQLSAILENYGIQLKPVWTQGETRLNMVVAEQRHGRVTHLMHGNLEVLPAHVNSFVATFKELLVGVNWIILAGSLPPGAPPGLYAHLLSEAQNAGIPCLLDSRGEPLLETLHLRPTVVKMNQVEFNQTFGSTEKNVYKTLEVVDGMRKIRDLPCLIVTCGKGGIVASAGEEAWLAAAPVQHAVNPAGAGDAASAALAWRFALGDNLGDALRWAAAVSAAAVLTKATGEVRLDEAQSILEKVFLSTNKSISTPQPRFWNT